MLFVKPNIGRPTRCLFGMIGVGLVVSPWLWSMERLGAILATAAGLAALIVSFSGF